LQRGASQTGAPQLLAELVLPDSATLEAGEFVLHPGLLDSALQAAIGLVADLQHLPDRPPVPFALEAMQVFAPCRARMWAWVRYAAGAQADQEESKIDIALYDVDGNLCVQLTGLASRPMPADAGVDAAAPGVLLACPEWQVCPDDAVLAPTYAQHQVVSRCRVSA
jgi:polyketide synthase PksL